MVCKPLPQDKIPVTVLTGEAPDDLERRVRKLNPLARVVRSDRTGRAKVPMGAGIPISFETDRALDFGRFQTWMSGVLRQYGPSLQKR